MSCPWLLVNETDFLLAPASFSSIPSLTDNTFSVVQAKQKKGCLKTKGMWLNVIT
jgi:hypothetical protein